MYIRFNSFEDKLIADLEGELDHHSAEEVRNKVDSKLNELKLKNLILDFSKVTFMDSSGIGVVIGRYKKVNIKNGKVVVVNPCTTVNKIFELSGMFKIIERYSSVKKAIEKM
ncbi:MAG: anti-sigma F factor antagonist [Clostridiaceae bacterium]